LSETDLERLWSSFDKDGDGGVTRDEFTKGLAPAKEIVTQMPPVPPPETVGPPELADALWAAIAEVATLRANGLPRGSPALHKAVIEQLSAFDATRSASLDKASFCQALQSYSPSLPQAAVEVLWKQIATGDKADIEKLAERLLRSPKPPPPIKTVPNAPQTVPPAEAGGPLWSALRRIRPALHEKSIYLPQAFKSWLPQGESKLTKTHLGKGIASLVGSDLPEPQLQALYAAMAKDAETGATMEEFVAPFGGSSGEGFEAFGRELLGRMGRSLRARAKGSISGAFAVMDMDGEGDMRIQAFTAAMRTFGDLNLETEQIEKLWELAKTIGGQKGDAMEFEAFKKVFGATSAEASGTAQETAATVKTPKADAGPSLEESCTHFARLERLEKLKETILGRNPDGFMPLESLASAVREAAPELSDAEVSQLCRLAPQKGGVLHGEDAYAYDQLLERFEDGRKDYHPVHSRDRRVVADTCRYVDQRSGLGICFLGTRAG